MNKLSALAVWLFCITTTTAQVGIGTLTPNTKSVLELNSSSKGLLLPRMSSAERLAMSLSSSDAGMMVYQTTAPKGLYTYDGSFWYYNAPIDGGTVSGNTLRWDGAKWIPVINLYNGGGSIGINTGTSANYQLQINSSTGPNVTRLQITNSSATGNPGTGAGAGDGLVIGIGANLNTGVAHILQQEDKPLWFGTAGVERVRIDSIGRVGINKINPSTTLDVNGTMNVSGTVDLNGTVNTNGALNTFATLNANGTVNTNGAVNANGTVNANGALNANGTLKIGSTGSVLQSVIRGDVQIDPPSMAFMGEWTEHISFPGITANATVYVSPGSAMDHMLIAYSMVSTPNFIDIKLMNMGPTIDMGSVIVHVVVIQ